MGGSPGRRCRVRRQAAAGAVRRQASRAPRSCTSCGSTPPRVSAISISAAAVAAGTRRRRGGVPRCAARGRATTSPLPPAAGRRRRRSPRPGRLRRLRARARRRGPGTRTRACCPTELRCARSASSTVGERGAEVAFPFREIGEAVPVAAGEEVEARRARSRRASAAAAIAPRRRRVGSSRRARGCSVPRDEHPDARAPRLRRSTRPAAPRALVDHRRLVHQRGARSISACTRTSGRSRRSASATARSAHALVPSRSSRSMHISARTANARALLEPFVEPLDELGERGGALGGRDRVADVVIEPADEPQRGRLGFEVAGAARVLDAAARQGCARRAGGRSATRPGSRCRAARRRRPTSLSPSSASCSAW